MDENIIVLPSALKHGLSEDDVLHVWHYGATYPYRAEDWVTLRIGPDIHGRMTEALGEYDPNNAQWVVFHAMTPLSEKLMRSTRTRRR